MTSTGSGGSAPASRAQNARPEPGPERIFVGIGANLGDPEATFVAALTALGDAPDIEVRHLSPVFESDPVGPAGQPVYLNAVIELRATLDPEALLARLLGIESGFGRDRGPDAVRWGARTLDLDLLFYGHRVQDSATLVLPHPRVNERLFVLRPLAAIAPGWPVAGPGSAAARAAGAMAAEAGATVRLRAAPPGWVLPA